MNNSKDKTSKKSIMKIISYLIPVFLFGAMVIILIVEKTTLKNSLTVIKTMPLWVVSLAVLAQIISYTGSGYMLKEIMSIGNSKLTVFRGVLITLAAASIGLVAGGWVASAATVFYWTSRDKKAKGEAAIAGVLPSVYNTLILVALAIFGMAYLIFHDQLSKPQFYVYLFTLIFSILVVGLLAYGLKRQEQTHKILRSLTTKLNKITKKEHNLESLEVKLEQFYSEMKVFGKRKWMKPALGSLTMIVFDMLTLYFFFMAAGVYVKPGILIAGYSISVLLGRSLFFIPGGAGVVEGGMAAMYTNLGIHSHITVIAVLGYRLVSFWIPILIGFAMTSLLKKTEKQ